MYLTPSHRIRPILEHGGKKNVAVSRHSRKLVREPRAMTKMVKSSMNKKRKSYTASMTANLYRISWIISWQMLDDVITTAKQKLRRRFCQQSDLSMGFLNSFLRSKQKLIQLQHFARTAARSYYLFWTAPPKWYRNQRLLLKTNSNPSIPEWY